MHGFRTGGGGRGHAFAWIPHHAALGWFLSKVFISFSSRPHCYAGRTVDLSASTSAVHMDGGGLGQTTLPVQALLSPSTHSYYWGITFLHALAAVSARNCATLSFVRSRHKPAIDTQ